MLTRLHVRYTANTFPEDLLFTQTRDQQSWQTRYVIQQPFDSSPSACSSRMAQTDCETMCKQRITEIPMPKAGSYDYGNNPYFRLKSPAELQSECVAACTSAKQNALQAAAAYYQQSLPARLQIEKQTLAELTGWSLARIEQMPDARKFTAQDSRQLAPPVPPGKTWWERLFSFNQLG